MMDGPSETFTMQKPIIIRLAACLPSFLLLIIRARWLTRSSFGSVDD